MKIRNLLDLLRTNYIELSNIENKYHIQYLTKNEIPEDVLEASVVDIIPIPGLRKQLFESDASEGDYVAAIKLVYDESILEPEVEEVKQTNEEPKAERKAPNFGMPNFGFDFLGNPELIDKILTPELINSLTDSEFFQDLMSPENVSQIINSEDFQEFMKNMNSNQPFGGFNPFGSSSTPSQNNFSEEDDDDDDEYEEI